MLDMKWNSLEDIHQGSRAFITALAYACELPEASDVIPSKRVSLHEWLTYLVNPQAYTKDFGIRVECLVAKMYAEIAILLARLYRKRDNRQERSGTGRNKFRFYKSRRKYK